MGLEPAPKGPSARIISMDQFRGYTVAGMFVVNFVGGLTAFPEVLKHHNGHALLQLCRHDHAQLHVRGRLFLSVERLATLRQARACRRLTATSSSAAWRWS